MNFNGLGTPQLQYSAIGAVNGLAGIADSDLTYEPLAEKATYDPTSILDVHAKARLAERTRIAQELHDTLLQGFFAVSMQLHAAVDQLRADTPAKPRFGNVLQAMDRVMEEGRRVVQGLRSNPSSFSSLAQALAAVPGDMGFTSAIKFRVLVEGRQREVWSGLSEELYRIGREAIINAYRHSNARNVEVEVEYRASGIRIVVRDDGSGIDSQLLQSGREGHWGLSGMKERAQSIGGKLRIMSRAGAGTEVELFVGARIAFEAPPDELSTEWQNPLFQGTKAANILHFRMSRVSE
ncbi:MAG: sensor histidine kinase [Candidatus Acidiferrum sp.]|jgi:signal transduction histidine kinase